MFIAVKPIVGRYLNDDSRFLIFDTKDLSLEYVSILDLYSNIEFRGKDYFIDGILLTGIKIEGLKISYLYKQESLFSSLKYSADVQYPKIISGEVVTDIDGIRWELGEFRLDIQYENGYMSINRVPIKRSALFCTYAVRPHYVFRYRDFLVIRFYRIDIRFNGTSPEFINNMCTVIINRSKEVLCAYINGVVVHGDDLFMTKIEMTSLY